MLTGAPGVTLPGAEVEAIFSRIIARIAAEKQLGAPLANEKVAAIFRRIMTQVAATPKSLGSVPSRKVISIDEFRKALVHALGEPSPEIAPAPPRARYRRVPEREYVVQAGTGPKCEADEEVGVRWHQTPRDPDRFVFFFSTDPELCLGLVTARLTDGNTVRGLFPLRRSCLRNEWEGECYLTTGGALDNLHVEALTVTSAAELLRAENSLAQSFTELVRTCGTEPVGNDPDSPRYATVWQPLSTYFTR
jgi:hypothetical protein